MLHVTLRKRLEAYEMDLSFRIEEGISILFGPTGSGKSTILKMIAGLIPPDSGRTVLRDRILYDSEQDHQVSTARRNIGMVFQHTLLFPHMNTEENIRFGMSRFPRNKRDRWMEEIVGQFSLESLLHRMPRQLSGGERQQVAIARALAQHPDLLLLDEPLSGMDMETKTFCLNALLNMQQTFRMPFLYVTHQIAEVLRLGKKVLVLDAGKLITEGPPFEVFNAPVNVRIAGLTGIRNVFRALVVSHQPEEGISLVDLGGLELVMTLLPHPAGAVVSVGIDGEDIILTQEPVYHTSARNVIACTVKDIIQDRENIEVIASNGVDFMVSITQKTVHKMNLRQGDTIYLLIKARSCHVIE